MNVQVLINKCSCAKEVYKIAIKRWRVARVQLQAKKKILPKYIWRPKWLQT